MSMTKPNFLVLSVKTAIKKVVSTLLRPVILWLLGLLTVGYAISAVADIFRDKNELEKEKELLLSTISVMREGRNEILAKFLTSSDSVTKLIAKFDEISKDIEIIEYHDTTWVAVGNDTTRIPLQVARTLQACSVLRNECEKNKDLALDLTKRNKEIEDSLDTVNDINEKLLNPPRFLGINLEDLKPSINIGPDIFYDLRPCSDERTEYFDPLQEVRIINTKKCSSRFGYGISIQLGWDFRLW